MNFNSSALKIGGKEDSSQGCEINGNKMLSGGDNSPYVKVSKVISRLLENDEKIISAISATRNIKLWEAIVTTCYAYTLKRVLLVFTDRRLIEVSLGNAPLFASRIRVVSYLSIRDISCASGFFRTITVKCRDGISLFYEGIRKGDMEEIAGNLRNRILSRPRSIQMGNLKNAADLCPSCFEKLSTLTYNCRSCGKKFKNEKNFLLYSLLIPGGAYMMAGFYYAAFGSFITEVLYFIGLLSYAPAIAAGNLRHLPVTVFYLIAISLSKYFSLKFCLKQIRSFIPSGQE